MAQGGAGGELGEEVEGVGEELEGTQPRERAQVYDRCRQPVALQRHLPQLAAVPDLHCAHSRTPHPLRLQRTPPQTHSERGTPPRFTLFMSLTDAVMLTSLTAAACFIMLVQNLNQFMLLITWLLFRACHVCG